MTRAERGGAGIDMFLNINPEEGKPQGSYFGITVTDGYDIHECYSWAWECMTYWNWNQTAYEAFPDINWNDDAEKQAAAQQIIAICEKLTDRPAKRFFIKKSVEDRG